MAVPTLVTDLSTTVGSNSPAGSESPSLIDDYLRAQAGFIAQIYSGNAPLLASVAGTDTITGTVTPAPTAYAAGQVFRFVSAGANTTTAVTLNVSGLGVKNVTRNGATALIAGDIPSGAVALVVYDGTQFQLMNTYKLPSGAAVANIGYTPANDAAAMHLAGAETATGAKRGAVVALTDGATITPDFSAANNFSVTLGGNRTLANPTNLTAGQHGTIVITQDGTGSRTLAYGSYFKFASGTAPTLTTTASAVDVLAYYVESATRITAKLISDVK